MKKPAEAPAPRVDSADHMVTPDDALLFDKYVKQWQRKLNLANWRIVMSPQPARGSMAEVAKFDMPQLQAVIRLGANWKSTPVTPHSLEQTAVHELLHIMLYELIENAKNNAISVDDLHTAQHRIINALEGLLVPEQG